MAGFCSSAVHNTSREGLKKHLWLQSMASAGLEPPGGHPTLGVNPSLMLLSPLQRRTLQPRRVLGRVAGRRAEHDDAHSLLALPALWRDDRSQPGKGMDTWGVSLTRANAGCRDTPCSAGAGLAIPNLLPSPGVSRSSVWMERARGTRCIRSACH